MTTQVIEIFQSFIHQHFLETLKISPVESTTPFQVENDISGEVEFIFISKCSPFIYAPLKGKDILKPNNVTLAMYLEDDNLIVRFELLDMILETEIKASKGKDFLSILVNQEKITWAIVDANSYNLIWLTNTIPFKTIRFHYKEIFERFGVAL